jgi:hypothetical protein
MACRHRRIDPPDAIADPPDPFTLPSQGGVAAALTPCT